MVAKLKSATTSSSRMSSSGKRKKVSDWARRWWVVRRLGVSGIWSRSIRPPPWKEAAGRGFPAKFGFIERGFR
ncbi:hypothetical protein Hanom_Chr05g00471751 [Helianthus anomalus]